MRAFTFCLFVLTIVFGCLSYAGLGHFTEIIKLTYAYLALSTIASALITITMRPATPQRAAVEPPKTISD